MYFEIHLFIYLFIYFADDSQECGGILIQRVGVIGFLNQNQEHDYGSPNCVWTIVAPEGSAIKLELFEYVNIESNDYCSHNVIQVRMFVPFSYPFFFGLVKKNSM